jgi:hypothetical protein
MLSVDDEGERDCGEAGVEHEDIIGEVGRLLGSARNTFCGYGSDTLLALIVLISDGLY